MEAGKSNISTTPSEAAGRGFACRSRWARVTAAAVLVSVASALAVASPVHAQSTTPTITGFTPVSGPVGTSVTITGKHLTPCTSVAFNGTSTACGTATATQVQATVPSGATTGPISVVTSNGTAISSKSFKVTRPAPAITVSPPSGPPGSSATVSGSGYGSSEAVDVYFDTTDEVLATTTNAGTFTTSVSVPSSATPGQHWVSGVGRHSGLAAQAAFTVNTNWPQFRDAVKHQGHNATENVLSPSNVDDIDLDWSYTTASTVNSSPTLVNGVVYVGSFDDKVYALNASTGTQEWSYSTGGSVYSSPAVVNGVVYVASEDDNVYALNAATGTLEWSYSTGGSVDSSPAVVNGVVYVGSDDGSVYALNASNGALLWSYATGGGNSVESSPAVANGVVYFGSLNIDPREAGNVYAVNASSGALLWSYPTGSGVESSPAVANGVVYVGSDDNNFYALNASDGQLLWSYATRGSVASSAAVADGVVYMASFDHNIYALNASNGALLWSYTTGGAIFSSPAVANGVLYVGSFDANVYALDASDGVVLWSYATAGRVYSSPSVANGVVYVGSGDSNVYAFGLAGGSNSTMQRPSPVTLRPNRELAAQAPRA